MRTLRMIIFLALSTFSISAHAQNAEMADTFRSEGKIYVVVAIVLIVLLGLIVYLFSVDRKITRMERRMTEKGHSK